MRCSGASAAGRGAADMAGSLAEDGGLAQSQQGTSQQVRAAAAPGAAEAPEPRMERPGAVAARLAARAAAQLSSSGPVRHAAGAAVERSSVGLGARQTALAPLQWGAGAAAGAGLCKPCAGFEGPCQHAHVGVCWGWGGHCRSRVGVFPLGRWCWFWGQMTLCCHCGKRCALEGRVQPLLLGWAARRGVPVSQAVGLRREVQTTHVYECACVCMRGWTPSDR